MNIRQVIFSIFIVSFSIIFASSCNNKYSYEHSIKIHDAKWTSADTLFFQFETTDSLALYEIEFNIRNTTDYQFQNLFMFVTAFYPAYTYSHDTVEVFLSKKDGEWLGKGIGFYKNLDVLFTKNARFRNNGTHVIAINHGMRNDTIVGIAEIGIKIKKCTN
ncbi:MAG: gliding motility lipoprotein GldH [Lentimicrobiaceae bacterium]|nr:gliding motility lipoprotein GldH [Lentimicrobiaceae bacterium]